MFLYSMIIAMQLNITNPGIYDYMGSGYEMEEYMYTIKDPDRPYQMDVITEKEFDLICKVVKAEAGNQSEDVQEAVATLILNRWKCKTKYPNDIESVIKAKNQFVIGTDYNEDIIHAVQRAIRYYNTCYQIIDPDVYYFRSGHYHSWAKDYRKIGDLYFSR